MSGRKKWVEEKMAVEQVPAELERRIRALETPQGQGEDFDGASWFWLLALGLVLPIVILIVGWAA
jgi:hypothetical protein